MRRRSTCFVVGPPWILALTFIGRQVGKHLELALRLRPISRAACYLAEGEPRCLRLRVERSGALERRPRTLKMTKRFFLPAKEQMCEKQQRPVGAIFDRPAKLCRGFFVAPELTEDFLPCLTRASIFAGWLVNVPRKNRSARTSSPRVFDTADVPRLSSTSDIAAACRDEEENLSCRTPLVNKIEGSVGKS